MTPSSSKPPLIRFAGIGKRFPGVVALQGVSFAVAAGEIHAVVGENGAGKSTLIKVLSGLYAPDDGHVELDGSRVQITSPRHAQTLGITTIHQELALAPDLTVVENVFLGRELRRRPFGIPVRLLDERAMDRRVEALAKEFELDPADLHRPIGQLGALKQHVTEILKALAFDARLVIMDEPTAALTDHERETLFRHMRSLRDSGISVLWITHRLEELLGLADRASVLRDGQFVGTVDPTEVGTGTLVRMMVGREVTSLAEIAQREAGVGVATTTADEVLRVEGISRRPVLQDVSFTLRRGEILGIAGIAGAGRTELARAILGADQRDAGEIYIEGKKVDIGSPSDAYRKGLALVPEERKVQGILGEFSVAKNITAAALHRVLRGRVVIDTRREDAAARGYVDELAIRTPNVHQKIGFLSGGNQQKAIIARCLFARPKVVIFDEPTQGIDIGAKSEVYRLINHFVLSGGSVIVISSELPELIGISDRILVMSEGRIAGEVTGGRVEHNIEASERSHEERIMVLATGGR
jgi:ribose transport system ATP-binding protein